MATSSIFYSVLLDDGKWVEAFLRALESSKASKAQSVCRDFSVQKLADPKDIRNLFGKTERKGA